MAAFRCLRCEPINKKKINFMVNLFKLAISFLSYSYDYHKLFSQAIIQQLMQDSHSLINTINVNHLQLDPPNFTSLHYKHYLTHFILNITLFQIQNANFISKKKR
jgi:hypothetical protein